MSNQDIVRAWKDENYRSSLSSEERAQLILDPAGGSNFPTSCSMTLLVAKLCP